MYIKPQRIYRNKKTGQTSPLIYEVISDEVTLRKVFTCGLRQGTWFDTPFLEIENVPPLKTVLDEVKNFSVDGPLLTIDEAVPMLFNAICDSIEQSWQQDKYHIVYHSSGWDSRIISAAIRYLIEKNGRDWGGEGLRFVTNRWEEKEARQIVKLLEFPDFDPYSWDCLASYSLGPDNEHFTVSLFFDKFWQTCNAPIPIPGNLWHYLSVCAILDDYDQAQAQGYAGLWANETWNHFAAGGISRWLEQFCNQYYFNVLAVLPSKIETMEYPLSDLKVLDIVARTQKTSGDKLREAVARYACYVANDVPRLALDDRGHPISRRLQTHCRQAYQKSWYAKKIQRTWRCPRTSEFSADWGQWGLASLCEQLVKDGVKIKRE